MAVLVTKRSRWRLVIGDLGKTLYIDTKLWCPKDQPIVIIYTKKQAKRFAARD